MAAFVANKDLYLKYNVQPLVFFPKIPLLKFEVNLEH